MQSLQDWSWYDDLPSRSGRIIADELENYCVTPVHGYNTKWYDNKEHQGGYSTHVRAQELFVFPIPDALASTDAASM